MKESTAEIEVLPPSTIEATERAHIDVQIATAHRFPRSLDQFKKRAMSMATMDAETAASCIYKRPVGEGKIAEGTSVRLAEIVAASYGNIRVQSRVVEQTERWVKCEGVAHDLETNYAGKSEVIESTVMKDGRPYSERQRMVVAKVCLAKAYRDAVFKVVPKALCKHVIDEAKKVAIGDAKTLDERRARVQEWVKSLKIDEKRVFAVLGIKGWADVGLEQLETLTGLRTAMADGDTSIDEAFPLAARPADMSEQKAPDIFGAGSGEPKKPAKAQKGDLETLRELAKKSEVTEEQCIQYLREVANADDSLSTLEEIYEVAPSKVQALIKAWPAASKVILGNAGK